MSTCLFHGTPDRSIQSENASCTQVFAIKKKPINILLTLFRRPLEQHADEQLGDVYAF